MRMISSNLSLEKAFKQKKATLVLSEVALNILFDLLFFGIRDFVNVFVNFPSACSFFANHLE